MDCVDEWPKAGSPGAKPLLRRVLHIGHGTVQDDDGEGFFLGLAGVTLRAEDGPSAMSLLQPPPELVFIRESIPFQEALSILRLLRGACPSSCVAVVAQKPDVDQAVQFVRAGAYDYLPGPLDKGRLDNLVAGLMQERLRSEDHARDRFFCSECPQGVPIVGRSPGMVQTLEMLRLVSHSRCNPILIFGETGTGKELAAQAVHAWRCGDREPLVAINCAALTANLLESELFGHVRGAFTGADREKTGLFEVAGTGSIFLDEISEMPQDLQAKLLRVLQEWRFRKVGGTKDIPCHATAIASSNRDLPGEVAAGRFRRDLYYRLAVFPITIPPLRSRSRQADIPLLAEYFLLNCASRPRAQKPQLSPEALDMLLRHDWPGNVRELRNLVERAVILAKSGAITPACLVFDPRLRPVGEVHAAAPASQVYLPCPPQPRGADAGNGPEPVAKPAEGAQGTPADPHAAPTTGPSACPAARHPEAQAPRPAHGAAPFRPMDFSLESAERELIVRALNETGWQRTRAAALLGITRATLHAKLKRYHIQAPGTPGPAGTPGLPDAANRQTAAPVEPAAK